MEISTPLIVLFVISTFALFGYLCISAGKLGINRSVSHSAYQWTDLHPKKWIYFYLGLVGCAFGIMPIMIEITPEHIQFISFLCPACLAFVGATPTFQNKGIERIVHFTAAGLCAALAIIWCLLVISNGWLIVLACLLFFGSVALIDRKNFTYWVEVGAFMLVFAPIWTAVLNTLKIGI